MSYTIALTPPVGAVNTDYQRFGDFPIFKKQHSISRTWGVCGICYRRLCFTPSGLKIVLAINIFLLLLNIFLICMEMFLVIEHGSFVYHILPIWFMTIDFFVTITLLCEIVFIIIAKRDCNWKELDIENGIDICVFFLSFVSFIAYIVNIHEDISNEHLVSAVYVIRVIIHLYLYTFLFVFCVVHHLDFTRFGSHSAMYLVHTFVL